MAVGDLTKDRAMIEKQILVLIKQMQDMEYSGKVDQARYIHGGIGQLIFVLDGAADTYVREAQQAFDRVGARAPVAPGITFDDDVAEAPAAPPAKVKAKATPPKGKGKGGKGKAAAKDPEEAPLPS